MKFKALATVIVFTILEFVAVCFPSLFRTDLNEWSADPDFYH
jgi:hypothetical protein